MKILILSLTLFSFTANGLGQVQIIELDSLTLTTSSALPFDEPFILKIPIRGDKVTSVAYIKHKGYQTLEESSRRERKLKPINIDNSNYSIRKQGTMNYLFVSIKNPQLLDPGKKYSFFWTEGIDEEILSAFDKYDQYKRNSDPVALKNAQDIILKIAKANKSKIGIIVVFDPLDTKLQTLDMYYSDPKIMFTEKYKVYLGLLEDYKKITTAKMAAALRNNAGLLSFIQEITERSDKFDSNIKSSYFKDVSVAVSSLNLLVSIDDASYLQLLTGVKPLDCKMCKPEKENDYDSRLKNIKETILKLTELQNAANSLRSLPDIKEAVNTLNNILSDFNASFIKMEKVAEARKTITNDIANVGISNFNIVGGSTSIKSFESRTKLSIAPDFGVVTTRLFEDKPNPYDFIPYLGVHINFRPLNRDVPFWSYDHKFINYFSAFVGWSLVNIKNGPNLTAKADSIGGFFNAEKGTLMTGIGIRLGNAVKVTTGTMHYFKYQQDPNNPGFYDSRKLKAWPFIGLSLDLALKDLLNGISDVFSAAPRVYNPPPPINN